MAHLPLCPTGLPNQIAYSARNTNCDASITTHSPTTNSITAEARLAPDPVRKAPKTLSRRPTDATATSVVITAVPSPITKAPTMPGQTSPMRQVRINRNNAPVQGRIATEATIATASRSERT